MEELLTELNETEKSNKGQKKTALSKAAPNSNRRAARERMELQEVEQFKKVLSFDQFQQNPIGAITTHLQNVIASARKG